MPLHDEFTPRGIFAPRVKFAPRGKLMHINGALDSLLTLNLPLANYNLTRNLHINHTQILLFILKAKINL